MELPLYELVINENDEESGVDFIALVDKPAIKRNWIAFAEQKQFSFKSDQEKRIISGPAMIPDQPIYRRNDEGEEYNVIFRKPTIEKIVSKFFKQQYTANFNLQHKKSLLAQGVYLIESFMIDEERGINAPKGFEDLPDGTWFISCKVDNDEIWDDFVKEGVFKGFSVEGFFTEKQVIETKSDELQLLEMLNKLQQDKKNIITDMSDVKNLFEKLKTMFQESETIEEKVTMQEAKLADGITIIKWDGELKEGTMVSVVSEDGEIPAPTGVHELEDGRKITIEDGGMVAVVEAAKEQKEDEKEAGEVEINMSEQEIMAIKEMCQSYESRIKALEDKMKVDSEMISEQKETIGKQKEAMSLMFQIVEKLADEPSTEVTKTESFNVKLSEEKQNELENLTRVVEFLNKK